MKREPVPKHQTLRDPEREPIMFIAEKRIPVKIGEKTYTLVFDVNTMCAYEEATGQFFLEACTEIMEIVFPAGTEKDKTVRVSPSALVSKLSIIKLRALLWASMHDYDKNDNPVWPLTISQVGKLIDIQNIVEVFREFLRGNAQNQPSKETLGESQADVETKPQSDEPQDPMNGGNRSIELPDSAFDSLKEKSEG
jgi:hypothetical protein